MALEAYGRLLRRRTLIVVALTAGLLLSILLDLMTGPSSMSVGEALRGIFLSHDVSSTSSVIIWEVRMPAAVMAVLVGAALSLAGAELQTILDNPLASPLTLGISSAASFGAALAIVLGLGIPGLPKDLVTAANAFLFAFGSVMLLQLLARLRGTGAETLVLFGIALFFTFNAAVALTQFIASQDALQQLVFWMMGSLSRADWQGIGILSAILLLCLPFSFMAAWRMTALRLGEDRARSFGIHVGRLRFLSLLRISLLAGSSVAFVGTIAFVGLVGPHIARLLVGEDHRFFLPASLLTGALVMSLASIAAKLIVPGVLVPIGIVTSIVGLPVFFLLIFRGKEGA